MLAMTQNHESSRLLRSVLNATSQGRSADELRMIANDMEVDGITEKMDSLSLRSPKQQGQSTNDIDISEYSSGQLSKELSFEENSQEELAKIRNDNYHLKLTLAEKEEELARMKKILEEKAFMENIHQLLPDQLDYTEQRGAMNSKCLAPGADYEKESPVKRSLTEAGFMSHFSCSPYKGNRAPSGRTETSLATTRLSKLRNEKELLSSVTLPFVQTIINIMKCSIVFKDEAFLLQTHFDDYVATKKRDEEKLSHLLSDLQFYCRQMVTLLNRELHFKEISQRLEFLFAIFLDPKEYDLQPQEHIEKLKEELMESLIKIFDYRTETPHDMANDDMHVGKQCRELHSCYLNVDYSAKLRDIEEGIDLCAGAMQHAYGNRDGPGRMRVGTRRTRTCSPPSTKSDLGVLNPIPLFNNTSREKEKLKGAKGNLEFIPIGYDENIVEAGTQQSRAKHLDPTLNMI